MTMATKAEQKYHVDSGLAVLHAIRDQAGTNRPMTQGEIADCVGCSKQLIEQIERKALRKLRHPSRMAMLQEARA
jgi:DNA-directed RNA polymerase sigma subunit (sigma70/sigma32)